MRSDAHFLLAYRPVGLAFTVLICLTVGAVSTPAQIRTRGVLGASAFLTRDRGWNFDQNLGVLAGVERSGRRFGVRGHAVVRWTPRAEGYAAVFPPLPQSARNGVTVGLHGLLRPGIGGLYLLGGPERYAVLWEDGPAPPSGSTWVAAGGLGIEGSHWAIEGRYGAFHRARGTTRGHLDVTLLRRF